MRKWNTAIGIYQNLSTAKFVCKELKRQGFYTVAWIDHLSDSLEIKKSYPIKSWIFSFLFLGTLLTLFYYFLPALLLKIFFVISILIYLFLIACTFYCRVIKNATISKYKNLVGKNEIMLIVQVKSKDVRTVLGILRQVKSGHPVSFLIRSEMENEKKIELPTEPLTKDHQEQFAIDVAKKNHPNIRLDTSRDQPLLNRLSESKKIIQFLRHEIADAEYVEQTITIAAEWFLDNMYVIEGSIEEIQRNLPRKYYSELPKIQTGEFAGLPRVYVVAVEIINSAAGKLSRNNIVDFLVSYQSVYPLSIGELWALPLMLRLRLIEVVQSLAIEIDRRLREGELANFWGNRLLHAARREPNRLPDFLQDIARQEPYPSPHFAEELLDHLFDEETVVPLIRNWFEGVFGKPIADVLHEEQKHEAVEQNTFSNSVVSLITLSQLLWPDIFEEVSPVDAILKNDPANIYSRMDFNTRNHYRETIETIARCSRKLEVEVANSTLKLAQEGKNEVERHVGYYLIDSGRKFLEKLTGFCPTILPAIRRWIISKHLSVYLGGVVLTTLLFDALLFFYLQESNTSLASSIIVSIFALIPISEVCIQVINCLLIQIIPPAFMPKMSYKAGIPTECKTLVVVPMMLSSKEVIQDQVQQLEIRYLANNDPLMVFGLFSDFMDAPEQNRENDAALLDTIVKGIESLNKKYGSGKFFHFHRSRVWSNGEQAWIGWERKRGKLEYLNLFLNGEKLPENILSVGDKKDLEGVRYVITLDADTQLPKNRGAELVELISHPLNRARISPDGKKLERGYTIIQPRVCTDFSHTSITPFSKIFSEPSAIDPYTNAISNTYQDLTGEGTYHGKGIYDVEAFHRILSNRLPEEHVLSHDLLEGIYSRVAFASDICLYDVFPHDYYSFANRQHRWIRGDFQIIDWLFRMPSKGGKKERNSISLINRWKIFDNLRRALLPVSIVLMLLYGWFFVPNAGIITGIAALVMFMPNIAFLISKLFNIHSIKTLGEFSDLKYGIVRSLILIALLPYEAYLTLDAIIRVFYRRTISHRNLLQWITPEYGNRASKKSHNRFIYRLVLSTLFSILVVFLLAYYAPARVIDAAFFVFLWALAPLIVYFIDKPMEVRLARALSNEDKLLLRIVARKTWCYFDDFMDLKHHWLPPDNYQTALNVEVAARTSPTNIGMGMMAYLNAFDLKYITCDVLIDRLLYTIESLQKLERFEGHFLNWYDLRTLAPLYPRYISTVDSGNLLASFWTIQEGLKELSQSPIISKNPLNGIVDTFIVLTKDLNLSTTLKNEFYALVSNNSNAPLNVWTIVKNLQTFFQNLHLNETENLYWLKKIEEQLNEWNNLFMRYFGWVDILNNLSHEQINLIGPQASQWHWKALNWNPSLHQLASGEFPEEFKNLIVAKGSESWGKNLKDALENAQWFAGEVLGRADKINDALDLFSEQLNLSYLYNPDRKLFAIGYNVDDRRLDNSFYDLLASEARIASLVAIAKGEVPLEHWWSLGRPYSRLYGRRVLLSWGGTMFEYLMPLLFNKYLSDSLLGDACHNAVACQMIYGKTRGIPWGISESAFSAIDVHKTYQYKSFGVPGLGLKRRLEEDIVVSPYSTALALAIDPISAVKNFKKLEKPAHNLWGAYGYYESIDFLRQRGPKGERGVIVHAFMAHHQGMTLTAINNVLNEDPMPRRFHSEPRICGVDSLLYERIPETTPIKITGLRQDRELTRLKPFSVSPVMGFVDTPKSVIPKVNLLSNETYSIMVTNSGGGYSRSNDIDITRWRSDTTCDAWGKFFYIKDSQSGDFWSVSYHPTDTQGQFYSVNFKPEKAEFKRKDKQIETATEVYVSPEDNVEVWTITLTNHSPKNRFLEVTSYLELALTQHNTDRMHPAFNKLFIQTEALPESNALLGFRRLRASDEKNIWAIHVVAVNSPVISGVQYETDRSRFIGRGRSLKHPEALDGDLTNSSGTVLDPIFSLRKRHMIESGQHITFSFITGVADTREKAIALIDKFKDFNASQRVFDLSWTFAQLELRRLRVHQDDVQLFQKLASRILYPNKQLRSSEERLRNNTLGQSRLWGHAISGDFPIVVVTVGDVYDINLVKQVLIAHAFWSMRGLKVDLVIFDEETTGYDQPVREQLLRLIQAYAYRGQIDTSGGVYLKNSDQMPPEELNLILSVAHAVLVAARGSLRQQLVSPLEPRVLPKALVINKNIKDVPTNPLAFRELIGFNGLGGYSLDGKEYVIYLDDKKTTPAPWINVMTNPSFGTFVTETGAGCTWYGNSQSNRLTPWSNDALLDPCADAIFIRDEERGNFWNPTPAPIRELDAYRIVHGQGYTRFEHNSHGIEQNLLIFVPVDDEGGLPVRIQKLHLINRSSRPRKLSVTAFAELILGSNKEETQMHVVTEWDPESQALFAYNRYHPEFGNCVAFCASLSPPTSFTGDRAEFIGRNQSLRNPEAMKRQGLSGRVGAALDPCAALQLMIEIFPDEQTDLIFMLGYAQDAVSARQTIAKCRSKELIDQLFVKTQTWWDKILGTIQITVPDQFTNISMNRWLLYQNLSCRIWGRTAFYQSSGAYGFRDQLQDVLALLYTAPTIAREHILRTAARQFIEGDVQHWWHPQSGGGIRTRITDDLLWLPYATAQYVRVTGDLSILEEQIPYLVAPLLKEDQHEVYSVPEISAEKESLLEHCRRAIYKGITSGPHHLPLIGTGDWNDGMNRVGILGKGESVWLAWFLIHVMHDFADLMSATKNEEAAEGFRVQAKRLAKVVEENAWDGAWYLRAYFDDGTPLGSKNNPEAYIDSLSQAWAVICGLGDSERVGIALKSVEEHLVKVKEKMVLLLTTPFDHSNLDPGYIKGYPPGVRENGGQYTHGSQWTPMAFARRGEGGKAVALLQMMHPSDHTKTVEECSHYKVEPYVIVADIYDLAGQVGRGGWSWYTGSAGWLYRIWLEEILGFKLRGNILKFESRIPKEWNGIKITYHFKKTPYEITINHGSDPGIKVDGNILSEKEIILIDDGKAHNIEITL